MSRELSFCPDSVDASLRAMVAMSFVILSQSKSNDDLLFSPPSFKENGSFDQPRDRVKLPSQGIAGIDSVAVTG